VIISLNDVALKAQHYLYRKKKVFNFKRQKFDTKKWLFL